MSKDPQQENQDSAEKSGEMSGSNPAELLGVGASNKDLKMQVSQLEAALETAKATIDEHKDRELRAIAEVENIRRKSQLSVEKARKFAIESFLKEFLPAIDSLEHAMQAAENADQALLEGLVLTEKMMMEILNKFGVEQVYPEGEKFDPEWHEALSTQVTTDVEANTVMTVVQKGYQLNGRLVRPARVIVAKAG